MVYLSKNLNFFLPFSSLHHIHSFHYVERAQPVITIREKLAANIQLKIGVPGESYKKRVNTLCW